MSAPLASESLLLDAKAVGNHIVVVGERGHILVAEHPQGPWNQCNVPTRTTLTGVVFHDERLGWAVGHDAIILRTQDSGESWRRVHFAPQEEVPLLDVWFKNSDYGIAVGAYGLYLTTSDGGESWSREEFNSLGRDSERNGDFPNADNSNEDTVLDGGLSEPFDFHLNSITPAPNGCLYIAAEAGRLFRSDDNGQTWETMPSPYHGSFFGVLSLRGQGLLAFGLRGHLFRSDDGGKHWQRIASSTQEMLTDGLVLADGSIIIVGLGGTVLVSHDGGHSFSLRQQLAREGLSAIVQSSTGDLIVVGERGAKVLSVTKPEAH
ncbi:MAG: YCF48-related protein [Pseudomonadota bacterium]